MLHFRLQFTENWISETKREKREKLLNKINAVIYIIFIVGFVTAFFVNKPIIMDVIYAILTVIMFVLLHLSFKRMKRYLA